MGTHSVFDFSRLEPSQKLVLDETKSVLSNFVSRSGKLHTHIRKTYFLESHHLIPFYQSVLWHTNFLASGYGPLLRLHCIWNGIHAYPHCPFCGKNITKHRESFKHGFNKYCSQNCSRLDNHPHDFMTAENLKKMYKAIGDKRRGLSFPPAWKKKLSEAALKEGVKRKKRETCMKRYGVENPGVLGAYSSLTAMKFIKKFLTERGIDDKHCYFKGGGVNGREFFQLIDGQYVSYDLAVFTTAEDARICDLSKLKLVVEFNGPWHHLESEVALAGDRPASPYPASKTIRESVEFDQKKKTHMLQFTQDYQVYWDRTTVIRRFGHVPTGIEVV